MSSVVERSSAPTVSRARRRGMRPGSTKLVPQVRACPRHVFLEIPLEIRYSVCKWLPEISAEIKYSHALPSAGNLPFRARTLRSTNHCNTQRAAPTIAQYNFFDHQRAWSRVPASRRVLLSSLVGMSTNDAMRAELSQAGGNKGGPREGTRSPCCYGMSEGL